MPRALSGHVRSRRLPKRRNHEFNLDTAQIFVPDGLPADEALGPHDPPGDQRPPGRSRNHGDGWDSCSVSNARINGLPAWWSRTAADHRAPGCMLDYTDDEMRRVRVKEQKKAAVVGEYAAQVLLDYPSSAIKDGANKSAGRRYRARSVQAASPKSSIRTTWPTNTPLMSASPSR